VRAWLSRLSRVWLKRRLTPLISNCPTTDVSPRLPPILIDGANAQRLQHLFEDWLPDVPHRQPFLAVIEGGEAVSICASVRISEAVHCAGVETHPDHRRPGYALDAVAGWASAVRSRGATPFGIAMN
jgi:hypothetical protein